VLSITRRRTRAGGSSLAALCEAYWYPIYAVLRRSGRSAHDAQDLTQAFFHVVISEEALLSANQESGRLRNFLLGVRMRQLSDQKRNDSAIKRGGKMVHVSFDQMEAEERYSHEPADTRDPAKLFSQAWAHSLLERVRGDLRLHFIATDQEPVFELTLPFLTLEANPPPHRELALASYGLQRSRHQHVHPPSTPQVPLTAAC
jgi:DNA-directed RNA polymerase specialized sigma24 family protein